MFILYINATTHTQKQSPFAAKQSALRHLCATNKSFWETKDLQELLHVQAQQTRTIISGLGYNQVKVWGPGVPPLSA